MGDVVVAGDKKETGSVEEITLSYVVVRIWDERRLIIPLPLLHADPLRELDAPRRRPAGHGRTQA